MDGSLKTYVEQKPEIEYMICYFDYMHTFWLDEIKLMETDRTNVPLKDGENWPGRDGRGPFCGNRGVRYLGLDDSFTDL